MNAMNGLNVRQQSSRLSLSEQMKTAQVPSFRALAQRSGLSRYQIDKIRRGEWESLSLVGALRLAAVLQLSLEEFSTWIQDQGSQELLPLLPPQAIVENSPNDRQETGLPVESLDYQYLENQLHTQASTLTTQLQRDALHQLESWLRNWPKVVYAIHHDKPDLLAAKILPLLRPLELLLQTWGVEPIGSIGDRLPYSPQDHLPLSPVASPGSPVEIQRPGYRHQGNLLFRAEVIPITVPLP